MSAAVGDHLRSEQEASNRTGISKDVEKNVGPSRTEMNARCGDIHGVLDVVY